MLFLQRNRIGVGFVGRVRVVCRGTHSGMTVLPFPEALCKLPMNEFPVMEVDINGIPASGGVPGDDDTITSWTHRILPEICVIRLGVPIPGHPRLDTPLMPGNRDNIKFYST